MPETSNIHIIFIKIKMLLKLLPHIDKQNKTGTSNPYEVPVLLLNFKPNFILHGQIISIL